MDGLPDRSKWTVDPKPKGWINGEQQVYTDTTHDNIRVVDGKLIIKGKKDYPNGNTTEPWSSGRMISQNKMDFLYGKVEVSAKLPRARGSWPAIWLMPTTSAYGGWPRSGEIDIMEHIGNNYGNAMSTVHTQNNNWTNGGHLSGSRNIPDAADNYHLYALEWSPDSLRFTFDSVHVYTYANPHTDWKDWPFDQKFHIILNVAIGGVAQAALAMGLELDALAARHLGELVDREDQELAVVADDGEDLAGQQVEVGAVDGGDMAVPLDQAAGLEHGRDIGGGHRAFFREIWSTVTARITSTPVIRVW